MGTVMQKHQFHLETQMRYCKDYNYSPPAHSSLAPSSRVNASETPALLQKSTDFISAHMATIAGWFWSTSQQGSFSIHLLSDYALQPTKYCRQCRKQNDWRLVLVFFQICLFYRFICFALLNVLVTSIFTMRSDSSSKKAPLCQKSSYIANNCSYKHVHIHLWTRKTELMTALFSARFLTSLYIPQLFFFLPLLPNIHSSVLLCVISVVECSLYVFWCVSCGVICVLACFLQCILALRCPPGPRNI